MAKCLILAIALMDCFNVVFSQQTVSSDCLDSFRNAMLQRHNTLRSRHGVPAMVFNSTLNDNAQSWADGIANGTNGFTHSSANGYGENLGLIKKTGLVGDAATCASLAVNMTNAWYNEISLYDFNNPTYSSSTGHFTQVVWKSSLTIGMGIGNSATNAFYGVAQYYVAGNVATVSAFAANVLPLIPLVSPQTVSQDCLDSFRSAMLQRHNDLRALHGVPAQSENTTLDNSAQSWADGIANGTNGFTHSSANGYGENFGLIKKSGLVGDAATCASLGINMTNAWYSEISQYNFSNPTYSSSTGHFTQLVWKASTSLGMGIGNSATNAFYGVAQYYVAGNVATVSAFIANVLPLI